MQGCDIRVVRPCRYNQRMTEHQADRVMDALEDERSEELEALHAAELLLLRAAGTQKWFPRDLQDKARNGQRREVVSLAFWQLVNDGRFELGSDLRVRRVGQA